MSDHVSLGHVQEASGIHFGRAASRDQADGGDVHLVDITTEGVVQVRFEGECLRCPSRDMTLRSGIETTLCNRLQDITGVEEVQN